MKRKTKKLLIWLTISLFLGVGIVRAKFPETWEQAKQVVESLPIVQENLHKGGEKIDEVEEVLGERIGEINTQIEQEELSVATLVDKVTQDSELGEEIKTQIETAVVEKTEEIKELPQEVVDEVRQQVRQEIRRQLCEEWLPEEK